MPDFDFPDFSQCQTAMQELGMSYTAAEAHGVAVGILSGGVVQPALAWQKEIYAEINDVLAGGEGLAQECQTLLEALYAATANQITDEAYSLRLFLPDASIGDYTVTHALADWAKGFLFGLGLAGDQLEQRLSKEGREALQDLYAIAQLEAENTDELDEENQQAQTEIEEYLSIAALTIHADMQMADRR